MKRVRIFVGVLASLAMVGCVTYPTFTVTISRTAEIYTGTLIFDGQYTGELTIQEGPGGESFSGRYVAMDNTPGVASVGGSGQVEAKGLWTGKGNRGSTIIAELKVGRGGHGIGTAKHANGKEFQISF